MNNEFPPEIEELRQRWHQLSERKAATDALSEQNARELERLRGEAEKEFGTSDVEQLKVKLTQMEAENLRLRKEYEASLSGIEAELARIEGAADSQ